MTPILYRNKKTNKIYKIKDTAINTTNAQDGQKMIVYEDEYGNLYVREVSEFAIKFDEVKNEYFE